MAIQKIDPIYSCDCCKKTVVSAFHLAKVTVPCRVYDEKGEDYVAFIIEEDTNNFYFGGSVTTDKFKKIDAMGEEVVNAIKEHGMPVVFEAKKSKATNMTYHDMIIKA